MSQESHSLQFALHEQQPSNGGAASREGGPLEDETKPAEPKPTEVDINDQHHKTKLPPGNVGRVLFWGGLSTLCVLGVLLFFMLVLHALIFPNGVNTGIRSLDSALNFSFLFVASEEHRGVPSFHFH
jgi:hypothetical protein